MSYSTTIFNMRDITDEDSVTLTNNGIVLKRNSETTHLVFQGLEAYAAWIERNADRLPNPELWRTCARTLRNSISENAGK